MNNRALSALLLISILQTGCSTLSLREGIFTGAGAGGGTAIAGAIDDSPESRITGAVLGGVAGLAAERYLSNREEEKLLEAYNQGRRDATVEAMNDLWDSRVNPNGPMGSIERQSNKEDAGMYEGIGFFTRPPQENPYELFDPVR